MCNARGVAIYAREHDRRTVASSDFARHFDVIPGPYMTGVVDRHVVVLAPEERRRRERFTSAQQVSRRNFAMTLGEFYCKGLTAPVMVEIKRDDVVFARVYDIRGRGISSLLSIPAP